jgi:hypothetical protein
MKKIIQLAAVTGLLVAAITPAHAFWGGGNNWSPWGGGNNWGPWGNNRNYGYNYGPRNYGYNYGPRNYGYNYGPNYGPWNNTPRRSAPERKVDSNIDNGSDERKSIWAGNNPWKNWRAPWSDDDSRWGSGPWDSFGDSMNSFISEMEGDVDMNMKIRAENEGKSKTSGRYRGRSYGNTDNFSYGYNRYPYPYYGRPVPQQNRPSTQAPAAPQSK